MRICLFFCVLFFLLACRNGQPAAPEVRVSNNTAGWPEGFQEFYTKFHADSLYQIAHIVWPLSGESAVQEDGGRVVVKDVEWLPENWRMHRAVDFSKNEYRQEIQQVGDVMIIERIFTTVGNFGIERRFAKSPTGEWEMIFYGDMRER